MCVKLYVAILQTTADLHAVDSKHIFCFYAWQKCLESRNPCMHGKALLIVKEMSALIKAYCKSDLMCSLQ